MSTTIDPDRAVNPTLARTTVEIINALATWSTADMRRLAYAISLGSPSALAAGPAPGITAEHDTDPGNVAATRPVLDARAAVAADLLHAWRGIARLAGVPLPVPGAQAGKGGGA